MSNINIQDTKIKYVPDLCRSSRGIPTNIWIIMFAIKWKNLFIIQVANQKHFYFKHIEMDLFLGPSTKNKLVQIGF